MQVCQGGHEECPGSCPNDITVPSWKVEDGKITVTIREFSRKGCSGNDPSYVMAREQRFTASSPGDMGRMFCVIFGVEQAVFSTVAP